MYAYIKVYSDLMDKMNNNTYPVGSLLPPEPELEKFYNVSRTTVRRAVGMLVSNKRVRVRQGHGTEVISTTISSQESCYLFSNISSVTEEILLGSRPTHSPMSVDVVPAPAHVADFFGLQMRSDVYRIQRTVSNAGGPVFGYKVNYLPLKLCPNLSEFNDITLDFYSLLKDQYGIVVERAKDCISAVAADFLTAHVLGIREKDPLIIICRKGYLAETEIEYSEFRIVPEYYRISVQMDGPFTEL